MPKASKVKKKVKKTKTAKTSKSKVKILSKPKELNKGPIKISKTYMPKDTEKYMCEKHKVFFRIKLTEWKKELVKACLLYTSPSPRDMRRSRMPSSA